MHDAHHVTERKYMFRAFGADYSAGWMDGWNKPIHCSRRTSDQCDE